MILATAQNAAICITDMDSIERSNLDQQFLFLSRDVFKLKPETAANAVKRMNPSFNIIAHKNRVGPDAQDIYDDFYRMIDGVVNASDNVEERVFMRRKIVLDPMRSCTMTSSSGDSTS